MSFEQYLDMLGAFFFAISGSLLASRLNFDIVGSVLLGSLTGLGGGVIRDLILGIRPAAFEQPVYLVPAGLAAITVYFLSSHVHRLRRAMLLFDAAGLGVFCVSGTAKALTFGVNPVAAVLLGVMSAVGGGVLRDVVANREPQLFSPRVFYAVPALTGATAVTVVWPLGWYNLLLALLIAFGVFALRVLALRFKWRVPGAVAHSGRG